jgi:hypothetical protein
MTIPSRFLLLRVFSCFCVHPSSCFREREREEREREHFSFFDFYVGPWPVLLVLGAVSPVLAVLVFLFFFSRVCPPQKADKVWRHLFPKASFHITNTNTQHINNHVLYSQLLYRPRQRHRREIQLEGTSQKYRASCFFHTCQRALVKFFASAREIGRRGRKISWRSPAEIA